MMSSSCCLSWDSMLLFTSHLRARIIFHSVKLSDFILWLQWIDAAGLRRSGLTRLRTVWCYEIKYVCCDEELRLINQFKHTEQQPANVQNRRRNGLSWFWVIWSRMAEISNVIYKIWCLNSWHVLKLITNVSANLQTAAENEATFINYVLI